MRAKIWLVAALLSAGCDAGAPGVVTVVVSGVADAEGLLLITEARDADGNQAAVACVPIDANPFDATFALEEIVGATPCEESAPITLDGGTYDLLTGVIAGGATEATSCAEAQVVVDGDVTVEMPALGACD